MTIITGTEYKANQGKYIKRANEGERVIISSHGGYVELKPVPETDKDVREHINAMSFFTAAKKVRREYDERDYTTLRSHEDIVNWFNSL
mgnify:CR=1 FL=1